jgi:hypothetical protein
MCCEILANETMGKLKSYSKFASDIVNTSEKISMKKAHEMPQTNYIYATKSAAFPGLVKIGKTVNVSSRLCGLNTSCAPSPHVIVAVAPTLNYDRDETITHEHFVSARREGEFFELDDATVVDFFATHITARYNIELLQNITRIQGSTMEI